MISVEVIDGKEFYTVREVAAIWGTSPQTAYKRIQRLGQVGQEFGHLDGHIVRVRNRVCVDIAIISAFATRTVGQDKLGQMSEMSEKMSEMSDTGSNDALIALLRDQLTSKDMEISRLHDELDRLYDDMEELHKLLDQAHQLTAMSQTKELEAPHRRRRWRR